MKYNWLDPQENAFFVVMESLIYQPPINVEKTSRRYEDLFRYVFVCLVFFKMSDFWIYIFKLGALWFRYIT